MIKNIDQNLKKLNRVGITILRLDRDGNRIKSKTGTHSWATHTKRDTTIAIVQAWDELFMDPHYVSG